MGQFCKETLKKILEFFCTKKELMSIREWVKERIDETDQTDLGLDIIETV